MRALAAAMLVIGAALLAAADDHRLAPPVEAIVPVPPTEHQRLHYFGQRRHHLVPGTVTINGAAYICDLDGKRFVNRDVFVAHLARHTTRRPRAFPPSCWCATGGFTAWVSRRPRPANQPISLWICPLWAGLEASSASRPLDG